MSRDIHAYREVAVQSRFDRRGQLRLYPVPGQAFSSTLTVHCARRLRDLAVYQPGTCFLLSAKLTDRLGGTPFLYAWHGDPAVVLSKSRLKRFLAQLRRTRL